MRWYHKVLILLTLVVLLVLFVFFGMKITTVHVEGTRMYSADEIKQSVFSRKYADNEFFFWIYQKMYGINTLPFVEEIDVSYDSLNTITLHVYDKKISGCIEYMGQYIYFDKDGIVLQSMKEKKESIFRADRLRAGGSWKRGRRGQSLALSVSGSERRRRTVSGRLSGAGADVRFYALVI